MHEELVKALRNCRGAYPDASCVICPYDKHLFCAIDMIRDAADAIEALMKENKQLKRDKEYDEWLHDDRPCPDFAREE